MNEAVLKNLLQRARILERQADPIKEKARPTVEAIAVAILQESEPNEVGKVLGIWQRIFGIKLDRNKITEHLESLSRWQSQNIRKSKGSKFL